MMTFEDRLELVSGNETVSAESIAIMMVMDEGGDRENFEALKNVVSALPSTEATRFYEFVSGHSVVPFNADPITVKFDDCTANMLPTAEACFSWITISRVEYGDDEHGREQMLARQLKQSLDLGGGTFSKA